MVYLMFLVFAASPQLVFAQGAGGGSGGMLIGMLLMFAVLFFLVILPQSRKAKKHQQLISSLQKGDEVVLQSGLYGKVHGVADKVLTVEIAPNVRVRVDRQFVSDKVSEKAA